MKRVYLRVLKNGDILVENGGDHNPHKIIQADQGICGNCRQSHQDNDGVAALVDEDIGPTKLLPFYAMTDREEAELLAGRATTEHALACAALDQLKSRIRALLDEEKSIQAKVGVVVTSNVPLQGAGIGAGIALRERLELEEKVPAAIEACQKAHVALGVAVENAIKAASAEISKSESAARGQIYPDFGRHTQGGPGGI